jgi:hypothetical protein
MHGELSSRNVHFMFRHAPKVKPTVAMFEYDKVGITKVARASAVQS